MPMGRTLAKWERNQWTSVSSLLFTVSSETQRILYGLFEANSEIEKLAVFYTKPKQRYPCILTPQSLPFVLIHASLRLHFLRKWESVRICLPRVLTAPMRLVRPASKCVQSNQRRIRDGHVPREPAFKNHMACKESEGSQGQGREREVRAIRVLNPREEKI